MQEGDGWNAWNLNEPHVSWHAMFSSLHSQNLVGFYKSLIKKNLQFVHVGLLQLTLPKSTPQCRIHINL